MKKIIILGTLPSSLLTFRGEMIKSISVNNKVTCIASNATHDEINKICSLGCSYKEAIVKRSSLNPLNDISYLFQLYKLFKNIKPDLLISCKRLMPSDIFGKNKIIRTISAKT